MKALELLAYTLLLAVCAAMFCGVFITCPIVYWTLGTVTLITCEIAARFEKVGTK